MLSTHNYNYFFISFHLTLHKFQASTNCYNFFYLFIASYHSNRCNLSFFPKKCHHSLLWIHTKIVAGVYFKLCCCKDEPVRNVYHNVTRKHPHIFPTMHQCTNYMTTETIVFVWCIWRTMNTYVVYICTSWSYEYLKSRCDNFYNSSMPWNINNISIIGQKNFNVRWK